MCHPFVVGELACGYIANRAEILAHLNMLPMAATATREEVLRFIEHNPLMGKGLGYIDVHLCAAALLTHVQICTCDRKLDEAGAGLGIRHKPAQFRRLRDPGG